MADSSRDRGWTVRAVVDDPSGAPVAVLENHSGLVGELLLVRADGRTHVLGKSAVATTADPATLYRGHSLAEVVAAGHDLLGAEILAEPGDPTYADVAGCLAPVRTVCVPTYTFVATTGCADKVSVGYGGRTALFDAATVVPAIAAVRDRHEVLEGLVGGSLPVLRFVFPHDENRWTELMMFAPDGSGTGNPVTQPVWYRVAEVAHGELTRTTYVETYPPAPPRATGPSPLGFYRDLVALHDRWSAVLGAGAQVEIPDRRLADLAQHSLVRAMITRVGAFPKYGVADRDYAGPEHDGFQDTFTVSVAAMLAWGQHEAATSYADNYLSHFVRDDGSIVYRGPQTGQHGRMLTVLADLVRCTGDDALLLRHRARIGALTDVLLSLRRASPAHGLLHGWCEADSCLEAEPERYRLPYLSNSAEAVRGFHDLGAVWRDIGNRRNQPALVERGEALLAESTALAEDLQRATKGSDVVPVIAGVTETVAEAVARDPHHPLFRAYRANAELLHSGCLTREQVERVVRHRATTGDVVLGVPRAYGYVDGSQPELGGFLAHGHAFGLLQHDLVGDYLLLLWTLAAHHCTPGTWTTPETRRVDPASPSAAYCVTAQLQVPLLLRWLLVFEEPFADRLWLGKAVPRDWLADGSRVSASRVPTRWGAVGFSVRPVADRVEVVVDLPDSPPPETVLRLRLPGGRRIGRVLVEGADWPAFDPLAETVTLTGRAPGRCRIEVTCE